jgi:hypothetical protein
MSVAAPENVSDLTGQLALITAASRLQGMAPPCAARPVAWLASPDTG